MSGPSAIVKNGHLITMVIASRAHLIVTKTYSLEELDKAKKNKVLSINTQNTSLLIAGMPIPNMPFYPQTTVIPNITAVTNLPDKTYLPKNPVNFYMPMMPITPGIGQ